MVNFRFIKDYFLHRFTAKTRHGIHSPFVYKLVDEVIYNYSNNLVYDEVEMLRKELEADQRNIRVTDLGAGSQMNNKKQKQVSQIAKNALKSPKLAQLLYRLANYFKPANVIELGTCLGTTTAYLSKAHQNARIITIEGCPETAAVATQTLAKAETSNVRQLVGNFDTVFPEIVAGEDLLDFVFVDGNHRKDATLEYFKLCLPKVSEKSVLIFDDIYWSKGMKEAWQEIKNHPTVTVTVDLFWIGLVFFKKGRRKEDFKIKF